MYAADKSRCWELALKTAASGKPRHGFGVTEMIRDDGDRNLFHNKLCIFDVGVSV